MRRRKRNARVLGYADQRIMTARYFVGHFLDGGVEGFGHEHTSYTYDDATPLKRRDMEHKTRDEHEQRRDKVYPCVRLVSKQVCYALPGVFECIGSLLEKRHGSEIE